MIKFKKLSSVEFWTKVKRIRYLHRHIEKPFITLRLLDISLIKRISGVLVHINNMRLPQDWHLTRGGDWRTLARYKMDTFMAFSQSSDVQTLCGSRCHKRVSPVPLYLSNTPDACHELHVKNTNLKQISFLSFSSLQNPSIHNALSRCGLHLPSSNHQIKN